MQIPTESMGFNNPYFLICVFICFLTFMIFVLATRYKVVSFSFITLVLILATWVNMKECREQVNQIKKWENNYYNNIKKEKPNEKEISNVYFLKFFNEKEAISKVYLKGEKKPVVVDAKLNFNEKNKNETIQYTKNFENAVLNLKDIRAKELILINTEQNALTNTSEKIKKIEEIKANDLNVGGVGFPLILEMVAAGVFAAAYMTSRRFIRIDNPIEEEEEKINFEELEKETSSKRVIR